MNSTKAKLIIALILIAGVAAFAWDEIAGLILVELVKAFLMDICCTPGA